MKTDAKLSRKKFFSYSGLLIGGALLSPKMSKALSSERVMKIGAHLWVYASKFPPPFDCTPILETVFSDLSTAGIQGVELMDVNLRHDNAVKYISNLIQKFDLPVTGTSFGGNLWDKPLHAGIMSAIELIVPRLKKLNGKTFGVSVGNAGRIKTEAQLDNQATILEKIIRVCDDHDIELNLHNHTYEVENDLHDLNGTLSRIPSIKLGPDINWLIRGGIDPVWFINTYGKQISYIHIRDQDAKAVWTAYVGSGVTDFDAIFKALKKNNFKGDLAIELAYPKDYENKISLTEAWKLSYDFVEKTYHTA